MIGQSRSFPRLGIGVMARTMGEVERPLGSVGAPSIQGALPTNEESTVSSMPPACPVCQQPAIHWGQHERNGVTEANYLCANEHGWLTKWVAG